MRLQQYILNENNPIVDNIFDSISRDCKPFLKELKKDEYEDFLYRATKKSVHSIEKFVARKNRKPLDTPIKLHNILDKMFQKKFGWKARSEGVFAAGKWYFSGSKDTYYGDTYLFFPIGNFKYVWSPKIDDLYTDLHWSIMEFFRDKESKKEIMAKKWNDEPLDKYEDFEDFIKLKEKEIEEDMIGKLQKIVNTYKSNNLHNVLGEGNREITFKCDSYYLVNRLYKEGLRNYLRSL